jgi:peroxiredoxin
MGVITAAMLVAGYAVSRDLGAPVSHLTASTTPAIGDRAPGFSLPSLDGAEISIRHMPRGPLLINFWASWCPYCRDETQSLVRLDGSCGRHLSIVGVAVNEATPEVARFAQQANIPYPILLDPTGTVANRYGVAYLPTTVLINRTGHIAYVKRGAFVDTSQVRQLVNRVLHNVCRAPRLTAGRS